MLNPEPRTKPPEKLETCNQNWSYEKIHSQSVTLAECCQLLLLFFFFANTQNSIVLSCTEIKEFIFAKPTFECIKLLFSPYKLQLFSTDVLHWLLLGALEIVRKNLKLGNNYKKSTATQTLCAVLTKSERKKGWKCFYAFYGVPLFIFVQTAGNRLVHPDGSLVW